MPSSNPADTSVGTEYLQQAMPIVRARMLAIGSAQDNSELAAANERAAASWASIRPPSNIAKEHERLRQGFSDEAAKLRALAHPVYDWDDAAFRELQAEFPDGYADWASSAKGEFHVVPSVVTGPSMRPTLCAGDVILAGESDHDVERGQIVIFLLGGDRLLKRAMGMPGETIASERGHLLIDGRTVGDYVGPNGEMVDFAPVQVPTDTVFVLGDNATNSDDSRHFGAIPLSSIEAEAPAELTGCADDGTTR